MESSTSLAARRSQTGRLKIKIEAKDTKNGNEQTVDGISLKQHDIFHEESQLLNLLILLLIVYMVQTSP